MPNYAKPTALKVLAGNPGKRAINKSEPKFTGSPVCPSFLTPAAKKEWKRITAELASLDMLRSVDTATLASYCQSYARWIEAEKVITLRGQVIEEPIVSKDGVVLGYKVKRNPATAIAREAMASMMRASSLFGFDPSSRSRLSIAPKTEADPFVTFMTSMHDEETNHIV